MTEMTDALDLSLPSSINKAIRHIRANVNTKGTKMKASHGLIPVRNRNSREKADVALRNMRREGIDRTNRTRLITDRRESFR